MRGGKMIKKEAKVKGYHLVIQFEIGINSDSATGAIAEGEIVAEAVYKSLVKEMPIAKDYLVMLRRPRKE